VSLCRSLFFLCPLTLNALARTHSLDVLKETSKLVFNSSNLTLGQAKVASAALKEDAVVPASALHHDEPNGRVSLNLPVTLPVGSQLQFRIDFEGELTGAMMGYYRSSWEDEGKTKYYALTQFEVYFDIVPYQSSRVLNRFGSPPKHAERSRAGMNRF
jgi:hypothetical protein